MEYDFSFQEPGCYDSPELFFDPDEDHDGHRSRLRQRVIEANPEAISNMEILEFVLTYAIPRQDVSPLAQALLDHFGSLHDVFNASLDQLREVEGMGETVLEWMHLLHRFMYTFSRKSPRFRPLTDYKRMCKFARWLMRRFEEPCCVALGLDPYLRPVTFRRICTDHKWAEPGRIMNEISDVLSVHPSNLVIILSTGRLAAEFSEYDIHNACEFSHNFATAGIDLLDVILVNTHHADSMRIQDLIIDPKLTPKRQEKFDIYTLRAQPEPKPVGKNVRPIPVESKYFDPPVYYEPFDCKTAADGDSDLFYDPSLVDEIYDPYEFI